jgi:hypothetical protein
VAVKVIEHNSDASSAVESEWCCRCLGILLLRLHCLLRT